KRLRLAEFVSEYFRDLAVRIKGPAGHVRCKHHFRAIDQSIIPGLFTELWELFDFQDIQSGAHDLSLVNSVKHSLCVYDLSPCGIQEINRFTEMEKVFLIHHLPGFCGKRYVQTE